MTAPFDQSRALSALPRIRHAFFGRRGGNSTGVFASMNMSESGGDKLTHVAQNRQQAVAALGFPIDNLATLKQVHSTTVVAITSSTTDSDERRGYRRQLFDLLEQHILPRASR